MWLGTAEFEVKPPPPGPTPAAGLGIAMCIVGESLGNATYGATAAPDLGPVAIAF